MSTDVGYAAIGVALLAVLILLFRSVFAFVIKVILSVVLVLVAAAATLHFTGPMTWDEIQEAGAMVLGVGVAIWVGLTFLDDL